MRSRTFQNAEKFMLVNDVTLGVETEVGQNKIEDVKTYELDLIFPPSVTQDQVSISHRPTDRPTIDGINDWLATIFYE